MNLSAVLGAVVAVLVSLSGQSRCLQYFWPLVAPDKEKQSRAKDGQGKRVVRPAPVRPRPSQSL